MDVVCAEYAGACYGVQRALDLALEAAAGSQKATTLGPLIHNPQVVADLERKGISVASTVDEITDGAVLIRSHGVVPSVVQQIADRGLPMIDATCPHVFRAQKAAAKLANDYGSVLVVGEAGHPEVEGLCAYAEDAGGKVIVASCVEELPDDIPQPLGVVVQTTQQRMTLDAVLAELENRGLSFELINTICFATTQRQNAAAELAEQVDAMIIIGGRNSSNTTRLADICSAKCAKSHHVESADELRSIDFSDCAVVGITAGASTPESQIDAVVSYLKGL